jgi:hypothetical protein
MRTWNKEKLLLKYPVKNSSDFDVNYVLGYGNAYWYPGLPTHIATVNEDAFCDPWNRPWEKNTKWTNYAPVKNVKFRWVNVSGQKIDVYLVPKKL